MLPGAAYRTQKSPPSPLSRDFYCNRRADVDSRSSLSSLPVEDSTTIGNFLCRFRLYGLFTVEFLRIRLLVSVTILAQTSIPGIVYVCGELQCYQEYSLWFRFFAFDLHSFQCQNSCWKLDFLFELRYSKQILFDG